MRVTLKWFLKYFVVFRLGVINRKSFFRRMQIIKGAGEGGQRSGP